MKKTKEQVLSKIEELVKRSGKKLTPVSELLKKTNKEYIDKFIKNYPELIKKLPSVSKLKECERKQLSDSYNAFIGSMLLNE